MSQWSTSAEVNTRQYKHLGHEGACMLQGECQTIESFGQAVRTTFNVDLLHVDLAIVDLNVNKIHDADLIIYCMSVYYYINTTSIYL